MGQPVTLEVNACARSALSGPCWGMEGHQREGGLWRVGPPGGNSSWTSHPVVAFEASLRPGVISQTEPGSRVIYSLWWKGLGRGSTGARQVQWEEGVRSLGNRNQRWGQTTAPLASGVRCSLSPLEAPTCSESLFLPLTLYLVNACALVHVRKVIFVRAQACVLEGSVYMRRLLVCDTGVRRSGGHVFSCSNVLSYSIWLTLAQKDTGNTFFLFKHPCVH